MDWTRNDNNIYIGKNMSYYVEGTLASKWSSPFTVKKYGIDNSLALYKYWILSGSNPINNKNRKEGPLINEIEELRNKNLGCWCKPDKCHGDVLRGLLQNPNQQIVIPKEALVNSTQTKSFEIKNKKEYIYQKYFIENKDISDISESMGLCKSTIENWIVKCFVSDMPNCKQKLLELGITEEFIKNINSIINNYKTIYEDEPKTRFIKDKLPKYITYFMIHIAVYFGKNI